LFDGICTEHRQQDSVGVVMCHEFVLRVHVTPWELVFVCDNSVIDSLVRQAHPAVFRKLETALQQMAVDLSMAFRI